MDSQAVTHQGHFGLYAYAQSPDPSERIFSGVPARIVLTIKIDSPPGQTNSTTEILVDGQPIPNGVIDQVGYEARTFHIAHASVIDLVLRKAQTAVTGDYTISVIPLT